MQRKVNVNSNTTLVMFGTCHFDRKLASHTRKGREPLNRSLIVCPAHLQFALHVHKSHYGYGNQIGILVMVVTMCWLNASLLTFLFASVAISEGRQF